MVKLTESDVREIRKLYQGNAKKTGGPTLKELGKKFGVSSCTVRDALTGYRWGWLDTSR